MSNVEWFKSEWLENDAKTLGAYIALLYARFCVSDWWKEEIPEWFYKDIEETLGRFVKGEEFEEAYKTARDFLECANRFSDDKSILDEIERDHYDRFKSSYLKFVNKSALVGKISSYDVFDIARKIIDVAQLIATDSTYVGSVYLPLYNAKNYLNLQIWGKEYSKLRECLKNSGVYIKDYIIPAPIFEREFVECFSKLDAEIINEISSALTNMGFEVKEYMGSVLAHKKILENDFTILVSYSNRIDESEVEKVSNLDVRPHLKIVVCKEFNEAALNLAKRNGILVLKGDYSEISRILRNLFIEIALQDLRESLKNYSTNLKSLAEKIENLI